MVISNVEILESTWLGSIPNSNDGSFDGTWMSETIGMLSKKGQVMVMVAEEGCLQLSQEEEEYHLHYIHFQFLLPENKQLCWSSPILTLSHIWSITSYKHTTVACSFINSNHTAGVDRVKWTIIIIGLTLASNAWCNKVVSWHYSQCHLHKSENSWVTSESQ